jgi:dTDP-4-dehydrorhamnose reductase
VQELNICDKDAVNAFFKEGHFDFVVNCAAYTAVTNAEKDFDKSLALNRDAVRNIGEAAAENGTKVIHISTDYVFDGTAHTPYTEDMPVNPQSVYGKTKYEGEAALTQSGCDYVIIRTAWLYSSFGNNFVKTMIKLGSTRDKLTVIFDQIGTPTYAADLAKAIMTVIDSKEFVTGTYHFSDEGVCSWYDFAKAIHKLYGINGCEVLPLETKDYPDDTPRPAYSVLNKAKIKNTYKVSIPHWYESLEKCIRILKEQEI